MLLARPSRQQKLLLGTFFSASIGQNSFISFCRQKHPGGWKLSSSGKEVKNKHSKSCRNQSSPLVCVVDGVRRRLETIRCVLPLLRVDLAPKPHNNNNILHNNQCLHLPIRHQSSVSLESSAGVCRPEKLMRVPFIAPLL